MAAVGQDSDRIKNIYAAYLTSIFRRDYYKSLRESVQKTCSHMDFAVGLGAATGGGTGLGILADPRFAWLCAGITTASTVLAVAKPAYHWAERLQHSIELEKYFDGVVSEYKSLVEEIQAARNVTEAVFARHVELQKRSDHPPTQYQYRDLSHDKQREIQNRIKSRVPYKSWWLPAGSAW